jgi:hypothetical protein
MTYIPDLSKQLYPSMPMPKNRSNYVSVGWLGNSVTTEGKTEAAVRSALSDAKKKLWQDISCQFGYHTCEICSDCDDRGEILVPDQSSTYVLPSMVDHYIDAHRYKLPEVVELALLEWHQSGFNDSTES